MKNLSIILFLSIGILSLQSCASVKQNAWLKAHRTAIEHLTSGNVKTEEKIDGLMNNYITLMDEGLQFANPVKGVKYIKKYQAQNGMAIDKIIGESNSWVNNMNDMQAVGLGVRVVKKPYIKRFIELAPKFKRKYETYKFILDMTSKVAGGFGRIGSKVIGI